MSIHNKGIYDDKYISYIQKIHILATQKKIRTLKVRISNNSIYIMCAYFTCQACICVIIILAISKGIGINLIFIFFFCNY